MQLGSVGLGIRRPVGVPAPLPGPVRRPDVFGRVEGPEQGLDEDEEGADKGQAKEDVVFGDEPLSTSSARVLVGGRRARTERTAAMVSSDCDGSA